MGIIPKVTTESIKIVTRITVVFVQRTLHLGMIGESGVRVRQVEERRTERRQVGPISLRLARHMSIASIM